MKQITGQKGYFKSFDGTSIYYEVRGEGPPILFAYGIGCLINHWNKQIKYFSQTNTTIVFDYRAHHKSDIPAKEDQVRLEDLAKDIISLLEYLNIKKTHICAHSFGVPVVLSAFEQNPELFSSFMFLNGFVTNPIDGMFGSDVSHYIFNAIKTLQMYVPETTNYLWKKLLDNQVSAIMLGLAGGFNLNLTEFKDIEMYVRGLSILHLDSFIKMFEHMTEYDGSETLKTITAPSLVIGGKKDLVTPLKFQKQMHKLLPNSELVTIPYGTHCSQLDLPELINLKIEKFIGAVDL